MLTKLHYAKKTLACSTRALIFQLTNPRGTKIKKRLQTKRKTRRHRAGLNCLSRRIKSQTTQIVFRLFNKLHRINHNRINRWQARKPIKFQRWAKLSRKGQSIKARCSNQRTAFDLSSLQSTTPCPR